MARRFALIALSAATATLAACSNPTAPTEAAKPVLGLYNGSGSRVSPPQPGDGTVTTQGLYNGSGSRQDPTDPTKPQ